MRKMKFAALACSLILAFHSSQAFAAAVDTSDPKTITSVQLVLNSMGYDCGGSSGALDEATGDAIRRYQNDHGLNADGVISDALLESLNANESSLKLPGVSLENFTNRYNTAAVNSTGNAASSMNLLTDISFSSLGYDLDNLSDVKLWINEGFGNSQNIVGKIRIKTNNSGSIADAVKEEIKACIYAIDDSLTSTSEAEEIYNKIMQGSESLSENGILYELGKNEDVISVSAEHEGFIDTYSAFQYLGGPELLSYTPQGSSAAAANNGSNTAAQAAAPATAPVSAEASAVSSTENYNGSVPANGTTAGSVPVDGSAAGTVPANGTTAGSVPVDGSTAGTVPANGTTAGTVPAGGYVSGDTSQTGSANTSASGENNAIGTAKTYLNTSAFSYSGLIEQLEFQGYTHDEAVYAADNCGADWNAQAAKKAKEELKNSAFNYSGLIGQLEFEGFTNAEATYGADNCGVNWNAQAVEKAKAYMNNANYSKTELIDQLVFEGFSQSQAEAAVNQVY